MTIADQRQEEVVATVSEALHLRLTLLTTLRAGLTTESETFRSSFRRRLQECSQLPISTQGHQLHRRHPVEESISNHRGGWLISSTKGTITLMGSTQLGIKRSTFISNTLNKKLLRISLNYNCFSKVSQHLPTLLEGGLEMDLRVKGLPQGTRIHPRI
jgi:hypothetical protein